MRSHRWPCFHQRGVHLPAALLLAGVAGCGAANEVTHPESLGVVSSAVATTQDFTDGTGVIKMRVKTCDWAAATQVSAGVYKGCAYCFVDSGWTRIGGGAEIQDQNEPGARLKASFPSDKPYNNAPNENDCTGDQNPEQDQQVAVKMVWVARSSGPAHNIRAYVVGIQFPLGGSPGVFVTDNTATFVNPPAVATAYVDSAILGGAGGTAWPVIGGGAEIVPPEADAFLTQSTLNETTGAWNASAQASQSGVVGSVKAYGIGIDSNPAGFGDYLVWRYRDTVVGPDAGYGTTTYTTPLPWVTTSIGGSAESAGAGRYLADLIPFNGSNLGLTVRTKAFGGTDSAQTRGFALDLAAGQSTLNAIRMNSGTVMSQNNAILTQSNSVPSPFPDVDKWYLEPQGSLSVFHVRNANPGGGGQCAYWSSGSTINVGACGAGNQYEWVMYSGSVHSLFQLQNLSSYLCIDTNGQGYVSSDLKALPCATGSTFQSMSTDYYEFPP